MDASILNQLVEEGLDVERLPRDFDPVFYAEIHKDLSGFVGDPLGAARHYIVHGREEGRWYKTEHMYVGTPTPLPDVPPDPDVGDVDVAVLVHVYYPELWPELAAYVANLRDAKYDLFVNIVEGRWTAELHSQIRSACPSARILVSENRGRDIGGFLRLVQSFSLQDYGVHVLMHTKRSPHVSELLSTTWRRTLLDAILGDPAKAVQNIWMLGRLQDVGMIGSCHWRNREVAQNQELFQRLLDEFCIDEKNRSCDYLSGTMMMMKGDVLGSIVEHIDPSALEDGEDAALEFHMDGQMAHAIERLIGNIVRQKHYRILWRD